MTGLPPKDPPRDPGQPTLARGATIGRYVVLGLVGRGGMGEVYAAYDPELDRKVAVKLLRVKPGAGVSLSEGRQRTLREAQAIARLSHPNVVVVFDVGTFQEQVFIAMEFVEGNTAGYWAQSEPRTWQEVLKVYMAAGRGLLAAHEKGLVHRDFKPDNVMVGKDGQVRVMDFGLARQMNERPDKEKTPNAEQITTTQRVPIKIGQPGAPPSVDGPDTLVLNPPPPADGVPIEMQSSTSGMFDMRLTRTGAMMGTPAYMAPEQFRGKATDARTDQFSFCVALYEGLYGERPFAGNTMLALTNNVVQGIVREAPQGSKVPVWIRRILLRGLRSKPDERYRSIGDLLDALSKNPYAARKRAAIGAGAAVLAVMLGFVGRQSLADRAPLCGDGRDRLSGVWDLVRAGDPEPISHVRIRNAFRNSGKSYAADVYATVSRALTAYAQAWANIYRDTCEATQIRHEQSSEVLDLRMSCLQERFGGLRALTDVFREASGEVVENAVAAVNALSSLDRCADVPLLRAVVRPPEDAATRSRVSEARNRLSVLKAKLDSGRYSEALRNIPLLVAEARALDYQPLVAESLAVLGHAHLRASEPQRAERALVEAYLAADGSRHDEVRAEVAESLVFVLGYQQSKLVEARQWAKTAEAVLRRLGGHDLLRSWLLNDIAAVHILEGDKERAVTLFKEALSVKQGALGAAHPDVGLSEGNLAGALAEAGRYDEALLHIERSILLLERGLGAAHPELATQLSNYGEILNGVGRRAEARQAFERAKVILERELGVESRPLADALAGIGLSFLDDGNSAKALVPLERAWLIRQQKETDPTKRATASFALARALWESNRDRSRARLLAEEAKADFAKGVAKSKLQEVEAWLQEKGEVSAGLSKRKWQ